MIDENTQEMLKYVSKFVQNANCLQATLAVGF